MGESQTVRDQEGYYLLGNTLDSCKLEDVLEFGCNWEQEDAS